MRLCPLLFTIGLGLGALAFAQAQEPPSEPPTTPTAAHPSPAPAPAPSAPSVDGSATSDRGYPLEYVKRPLTLPASILDLNLSVGGALGSTGPAGGASALVRYGVTSWLELAVTTSLTGIGTPDGAWRGVGLSALFAVIQGGTEFAVGVTAHAQPVEPGLFERSILSSVALDLPLRVRFGDLSLTVGTGVLRYEPGPAGLGNSSIGTVNLDVRAVYQLHRHLAVVLGSKLVTVYGFGFLNGFTLFHPLTGALVFSPSARWDLSAVVIGGSIRNDPSAFFTVSFRPCSGG